MRDTLLIRTVVIGNISINHFCKKPLVSVVKFILLQLLTKKKDRDPTILAVTNIHTRFYIQIHEYPSTRILTAALLGLESSTLPLSHCALIDFIAWRYFTISYDVASGSEISILMHGDISLPDTSYDKSLYWEMINSMLQRTAGHTSILKYTFKRPPFSLHRQCIFLHLLDRLAFKIAHSISKLVF